MYVGEADDVCPLDQAEVIRDTIKTEIQQWKTIPNEGHIYFASANEPEFVDDVVNQLKTGYTRPEQVFLQ